MGKVKTARKALKQKHANKGAKTHKGAKDRIKVTSGGKFIIGRSGVNHRQEAQTKSGRRSKRKGIILKGKLLLSAGRLLNKSTKRKNDKPKKVGVA